ncbi:MAG: DUF2182 domain-containing protein [Solirubrobacteraceae bacterium]
MAPLHGSLPAVVLALAVAAAWHVAPVRRRALRHCSALRAPAIRGRRACLDWSRSGAVTGGRCIATCWALMLPMAILHSPVLTVGGALIVARSGGPPPTPSEGRAGPSRRWRCSAWRPASRSSPSVTPCASSPSETGTRSS